MRLYWHILYFVFVHDCWNQTADIVADIAIDVSNDLKIN